MASSTSELLRPTRPEDEAFLWQLNQLAYEEVVRAQFGAWDLADQKARCDTKWKTQSYSVIVLDGVRVGAVSSARSESALTLLEILVLPVCQGRGIGTEIVRRLQQQARALGLPLVLQVLRMNRARGLYERLGFRVHETTETHYRMRWDGAPSIPASLLRLLADHRSQHAPQYPPFFNSDHGPMTYLALHGLGHGAAEIEAFAARYRPQLAPLGSVLGSIEPSTGQAGQGRIEAYPALVEFYATSECSRPTCCAGLLW